MMSVSEGGLGLGAGLVDMRGQAALADGGTQLVAQEGAGAVARDLAVVMLDHLLDHLGIGVHGGLQDLEAVVVDDDIDPVSDGLALALDRDLHLERILRAGQAQALEVEEEALALGLPADALGQGDGQQAVFEAHRFGAEDAGIHQDGLAHDRAERHPGQDVALYVDAGRDLDQLQALGREREDAALGDVEHLLAGLGRVLAAEGDLFDRLDELAVLAFLLNRQLAVLNG